ncbi:hypothetical protein HPB47_026328, partial [Ixodes persulcatus]
KSDRFVRLLEDGDRKPLQKERPNWMGGLGREKVTSAMNYGMPVAAAAAGRVL